MKHQEIIEILSSSSDNEDENPISDLDARKRSLNITFTQKDLETLNNRNWLNDSIINSYINLMRPHMNNKSFGITNSFFFTKLKRDGPQEALNWEGIKGKLLNEFELFLIPICTGTHWILFVLDFEHSFMFILDSLGLFYENEAKIINNFLHYQGISELPVGSYEVPRQLNGYDCGVFLLQNIRCILFGEGDFTYSQEDIPFIRNRIKNELINCELVG